MFEWLWSHITDVSATDGFFDAAVQVANEETGDILGSSRSRTYEDLVGDWQMMVVKHEGVSVFVENRLGPYEPTMDLLSVAIDLVEVLEADGYHLIRPILGDSLHANWLGGLPSAGDILGRSIAGVLLSGAAREEDRSWDQLFLAFLFELPSVEDQVALSRAWKKGSHNFASLVVGLEQLVAIIISNSSTRGIESFESDKTLERFVEPFQEVLRAGIQSD